MRAFKSSDWAIVTETKPGKMKHNKIKLIFFIPNIASSYRKTRGFPSPFFKGFGFFCSIKFMQKICKFSVLGCGYIQF
jgi:hypothetical protein